MKRILICALTMVMLLQCTIASAELDFEVMNAKDISVPTLAGDYNGYIVTIEGKEYLVGQRGSSDVNPTEYNKTVYDNLAKINGNGIEYIEAGDYYVVRQCFYDVMGFIIDNGRTKLWNQMMLVDKDFNVVKTEDFNKETYIMNIGYLDGKYYCILGKVGPDTNYVSEDFENWTEIDTPIPKRNSEVTIMNDYVSFDRETYSQVIYEDPPKHRDFRTSIGDWFIDVDDGSRGSDSSTNYDTHDIYLSNDNIYFVKIRCPSDVADKYYLPFEIIYVTEYGDKLLFNTEDDILAVSKQQVYDELNRLKEAPRVKLNDKILGFSSPPVIENDRTLVPMRFLFEQMGAEVEWNEATESAIVTQNNETVMFSLNDAEASVNNKPVTMDVPARLINDKTMVPLRFLSEELGYTVEWDENTNMVT
ncbi:MAG: copper amine oxidase N-terminal domain-containing protein, partial [Eubacteriales bacterium]|nr:copper amine oxidase N-terminal domain-containing protein [Eubacteriales bacterium]